MKRTLAILFATLIFFSLACRNKIDSEKVDYIELVQVQHPYLGGFVDSRKLDQEMVPDFLNDFADKSEEIIKFYSCYVIKIHLKNGELISYRTNGHAFEKFIDKNTTGVNFTFNKDINLITKYWGIPKDQFCDTTGIKAR
jgi:hypothetical protein